jgi:hemerythrin-like metal-binding protein
VLLLWTENLRVGVEKFDEDNKRLVASVNALHGVIQAGESARMLKSVLDELERYAWQHCTGEEVAFLETGYPDAAAHIAEHDQLRQMIEKMKQQRDLGTDAMLPVDVMNLIYIWITNHICNRDRKYSEFMRVRGILGAPPDPQALAHAARYSTPAAFLASDVPGANQETMAHTESMAPMIASESVIGTSSQRAASILRATKASSAPSP